MEPLICNEKVTRAWALREEGLSHRAIGRELGIHHKTVQRWLVAPPCERCGSVCDPRAERCLGCWVQLLEERRDSRARDIVTWYCEDELPWQDLVERLGLTPGYVRRLLEQLRELGYSLPTRFKRHGGRLVATNRLA